MPSSTSSKRRFSLSANTAEHLAVSLILSVIGYVTTALHTLRAQQHRSRVDRVNEQVCTHGWCSIDGWPRASDRSVSRVCSQLKALYGPLLACVTASKSSYDAMLRQAARNMNVSMLTSTEFAAAVRLNPQGPAARTYRAWVRDVLMPLSERAAKTVIERADLLEGSEISPLLLQLVAHVSAYRVILRRWDEGELERETAIPYPDDLEKWVSETFDMLKQRQAGLLGIAADGSQGSPLMQLIASKL